MSKIEKNQRWAFYEDAEPVQVAPGVVRRILAYCDGMMCVENKFDEGAVGALHSHPHTQITYVVEGEFEFSIAGIKKVIKKGDSMLKQDAVEHGGRCLKKGILLDIFIPMREDFL